MLVATVLLIASGMNGVIYADLFTSLAEMELLLEAEKDMPKLLDVYISRFQGRLDAIRKCVILGIYIKFR